MNESYLTAEEIYAIDDVKEVDLLDYLFSLPEEKRELANHIFSKNRRIGLLKVIADEIEENNDRLRMLLEEAGIEV